LQIGLTITYHLPFPSSPFSFSPLSDPDPVISLSSLQYERASVLFNVAAVYSGLGADESRADGEGIKRALAYLQNAAGALSYLSSEVVPLLKCPSWSAIKLSGGVAVGDGAAGYDMTESFINTLQNMVLAQAQECFWQKAVLEGTYKNGIIGRLAMKVRCSKPFSRASAKC
jgi:programmed cell death 6-interacting protein